MRLRGRHWVAIWLVSFLVAAAAVVGRQTASYQMARALAEHRAARATLEGRRDDLDRRLRAAMSRAVLLPRARARGLRLPADSEIILLPVPPGERR